MARRYLAGGLASASAAALLTIVLSYALFELRHTLLMLYVAGVCAVLFSPFVDLVRRIRVRRFQPTRGLATAIVTLVTAAVIGLLALAVVPPLISDARQLEADWPARAGQLFDSLHQHVPFSRSITASSLVEWLQSTLGQTPVLTLSGTAMDLLAMLLLSIYLLADGPRVFAWCLSLVPEAHRSQLDTALRDGATRMHKWVAAQGLMMLIHGGASFVTFWLLGLPFFLPLGVFAAVANIIPVLGPILTLIAASVVAVTSSPGKLLGVVIFYLVYHNTEGAYLQPRIMSAAVDIPGAAVIVALMLGDAVAGIVGMLVSVPTAVLLAALKRHYVP